MSRIAALLRLPSWIERAWEETHAQQFIDSESPTLIIDETVPAELLAAPDLRF
jgi:hypothetical protein